MYFSRSKLGTSAWLRLVRRRRQAQRSAPSMFQFQARIGVLARNRFAVSCAPTCTFQDQNSVRRLGCASCEGDVKLNALPQACFNSKLVSVYLYAIASLFLAAPHVLFKIKTRYVGLAAPRAKETSSSTLCPKHVSIPSSYRCTCTQSFRCFLRPHM